MATVTIACNIPGGLILGYTQAPNRSPVVPVVLAGPPISGGYSFTEVDATYWANWVTTSQTPTQAPSDGNIYNGNPAALTAKAVWET
ncbi:MAG: hypothetical protein ACRDHZ_01510 [Ktedonobacteraceae bacterium]